MILAALLLALPTVGGVRVGERFPDVEIVDSRWLRRQVLDAAPAATVVMVSDLDCPVAARVRPRLAELERELRARGVACVLVEAGSDVLAAAARAVEAGVEFPCGVDVDGELARALGVERVPELFVVDRERRVRYRGRFDARERVGGTASGELRADLREALEDVLASRDVRVASTRVEGCRIDPAPALDERAPLPWIGGVDALFERHCVACHAEGGSAPFALATHSDAASKRSRIAEAVRERRMPPWFASREHGRFDNERGLDGEERAAVLRWCEQGAPRGDGDERALAPAREPTGWRIGTPDLVLTAPSQQSLPASGRVPYRYVVLPHVFLRDTWVEAIEIKPSNAPVVHHANLGFWKVGSEFRTENFLTGHVPGGDALVLDPGVAVRIPAGSVVGVQIHYVTTGREETERISVGLRFPREVVRKRLRLSTVTDTRFEIPPQAPAHPVDAARTLPEDALGVGLFVHMHYRGRDMRVDAVDPAGERANLLFVPSYSFDWQQSYRWATGARAIEKGTRIEALAHFDNSRSNPWNPDPARAVRFGQETDDEMMYAFFFWVARDEDLALRVDPRTGAEAR